MAYTAILEARKAAEAKQESVREAVRLGLQMKRDAEDRKSAELHEGSLQQAAY